MASFQLRSRRPGTHIALDSCADMPREGRENKVQRAVDWIGRLLGLATTATPDEKGCFKLGFSARNPEDGGRWTVAQAPGHLCCFCLPEHLLASTSLATFFFFPARARLSQQQQRPLVLQHQLQTLICRPAASARATVSLRRYWTAPPRLFMTHIDDSPPSYTIVDHSFKRIHDTFLPINNPFRLCRMPIHFALASATLHW